MTNTLQVFPPFIRGAIERKDMNVLLSTRRKLQEILSIVHDKHHFSHTHDFTLPSNEKCGNTVSEELEVVKRAIGIVMEKEHSVQ
ncbi:MAG: hypothetical protein PHN60_01445 [Candidatus Gracilibacteria bacterium]|nr:hypothetical protein [Candidatus Gracilibacteria bacterium]